MTKEELKSALISHGVPTPPASARKEEFVQAYEEHVAPAVEATGEFSSDDEAGSPGGRRASNRSRASVSSRKSGAGSPRKSVSGGAALEESGQDVELTVDIAGLDDDQLLEMLQRHGVEAGPIVGSTRAFYQKKLSAALAGGLNGTNGKEFSDTEPEDEEEQPAVEVVPKKRTPRSARPAASPLADSGLRQRLPLLGDELDSSPASPGARRSIHSYKVTETTRQVTTRGRDGSETVDTHHSMERSESAGGAGGGSRLTAVLYPLLKLAILAVLLGGLYIVFTTPSDGVTPIDKVAEIINSALPPVEEALPAAEEPVAAAAAEPVAAAPGGAGDV